MSKAKQEYIETTVKSLHGEIMDVVMENSFLIKQENWDVPSQEMKAVYDSFRIIHIITDKLLNRSREQEEIINKYNTQ